MTVKQVEDIYNKATGRAAASLEPSFSKWALVGLSCTKYDNNWRYRKLSWWNKVLGAAVLAK